MPDADTSTVDGVEPTIKVRYVGTDKEDPNGLIKLADIEGEGQRELVRNGPAVNVTPDEFAQLAGRFQIIRVDEDEHADEDAPLVNVKDSVEKADYKSFPETPPDPLQSGRAKETNPPAHLG